MTFEAGTDKQRSITYEKVGEYGLEIGQEMTAEYADSIRSQLPAPISLYEHGINSTAGILKFGYPNSRRNGEVEVKVTHRIIARRPDTTDNCMPVTDGASPWHEYIFSARQHPYGAKIDNTADMLRREVDARFIQPVDTELILNRPKVISRLVSLAAGWAWPEENAHHIAYSDGSCYEYAPEADPELRLAVVAKTENLVTANGFYEEQVMQSLLYAWDEPDMAYGAQCARPRHDFHVDVRAFVPKAGLDLSSIADDLASIACDAWSPIAGQ